jgi:hypothetical protein
MAKQPPRATLAGAYQALGQEQKALDFYNQSLPIRREVGDRGGEAATS